VQRRLRQLKAELESIQSRKTREVHQRNLDHFTVGLVGYTNAGKSTLFNRVTSGGAFAHAKLFATLSTRIERWDLGGGNHLMLSDTVGFIRRLPHHLVASFRSTLEETVHADLIVIVVDVSDHNAAMQLHTVQETLDEIGASGQPRLVALNKVDALDRTELLVWLNRHPDALAISAATGEGIDELARLVKARMLGAVRQVEITLPLSEARAIDFLEKRTEVVARDYRDDSVAMQVRIGRRQVDQMLVHCPAARIDGRPALEGVQSAWSEDGAWASASSPDRVPPHELY
jgi:GTP-binding protein HflX